MITPKKSLGQNFLTSAAALRQIVEAGELSEGEVVLEIGPGKGVLTEALLAKGVRVVAIEKDDRLIPILEEKFGHALSHGSLTLIHGDGADAEMRASLVRHGIMNGAFKLIANIPYYVTGLILRTYLDEGPRPKTMVLLVQKEVADEIAARDKREGVLSIAIKTYGVPRVVAKVPRGAFVPAPNVDSAIIAITNITDPFTDDVGRSRFFDLLRSGFRSKRKMLVNNLLPIFGNDRARVERCLSSLRIDPTVRAERLTSKEWVALTTALYKDIY